jgi:hypothetical protein
VERGYLKTDECHRSPSVVGENENRVADREDAKVLNLGKEYGEVYGKS